MTSWYSVSKFINFVQEKHHEGFDKSDPKSLASVELFFDPKRTFINKYKKKCIKPIAMRMCYVKAEHEFPSEGLAHESLMKYVNNTQPIISFDENSNRIINENADMQKLIITNNMKETKSGISYYPSIIQTVTNKKLIETLKSKIVNNTLVLDIDDINENFI